MKQHEPLARATLDTLPMNIAVLSGDGTILFTNRSWEDFGSAEEAEEPELTGQNYFGGIDLTADTYAAQAVEGIQSVMDGEQTLFTLEYPCDTPEESKWFLMRVVPLSAEDDSDQVVVAHIDITERKLAELRADERARELQAERQRLEHLLSRINGLVQDVMESLMEAQTREEIEQALCKQFVDAEPFVSTWVGELDLRSEEITPIAWAGNDPQETTIPLDDERDPTALAASSRDLQVVGDIETLPEDSVHRDICPDARSIAALPLVADDTLYGVLTAYADSPDAFDERETTILEALGRTVATAINAIERKRILTADELVEVELEIKDDDGFFFELTAGSDAILEYAGSVRNEGDTFQMFFTVEGVPPQAVVDHADAHPDIAATTHVSDFDDHAFFEFEVKDPPIVASVADFGGETRAIRFVDGAATVRAEFAVDADVRTIVDALSERYDSVELLAYRERERQTQTRQEFVTNLMDELTDRQRTAIQKAFVGGFFEWPRNTSGEDLAASMGISPSTYHQHLRAAQRKVFTEIFDR